MRERAVFIAVASLAALPLFGGAFAPWLGVAIAVSIAVAAIFLPRRAPAQLDRSSRTLALLAGAAALWACAQCIPLDTEVRSALARGAVALDASLGREPGTTALSYDPAATQRAALALLGVSVLVVACGWVGRQREGRTRLLAAVAVGGTAVAGLGLLRCITDLDLTPGAPSHAQPFATFVNRNHAAALGILTLPILVAFAWSRTTPRGRFAVAGGAALVLMALAANASRGAAVGLGVALVVGAWAWRGTGRVPRTLAALVISVLAAGQALARHSDTITVGHRVALLRDSLHLVQDAPFAGIGLGAFAAAYGPYQSVTRPLLFRHCECEPLEWMVEGGLPLAMLGVGALGVVCVAAWRVLRSARCSLVERAASLGLFAVLIQSLVDFPLRVPGVVYPTLLVAVTVGAASMTETST